MLVGGRFSKFLSWSGFGGGGAEPGDQVPRARDYANYRRATVFLAGGEPDVPPVGGRRHQYDHCARGGTGQGGGLVLCQHCHGNRL